MIESSRRRTIAPLQFTAKTAKIAKDIAKAIALLTHRIIAAFFRGLNAAG